MFYDQHKDELSTMYTYVINACITASAHVPNTSSYSNKVIPGYNDNELREDALSWHHFWNINIYTYSGMHGVTRARYHREIRHLKKNAVNIKMHKMSDAIMSDKTRDFWSEIRTLKVHNTVISNSIDGYNDNYDIMNVFRETFMSLYNSVPYDKCEMLKIKSIIKTRIDTYNIHYNISINDVIDAVMHLKSGKSDGNEGLNSDSCIHGTNKLYAILALLFTSLLLHGYSPDSMILGTMIPIPKDTRTSLCDSSNYRTIALSSMFSKVLNWVILMKEQSSLLSSKLQFGFKKGLSSTQCTYSLLETIDYYNYKKSGVFVLLLDAWKAFDRVNYCNLFTNLLKCDVSQLVLRLLLYMYANQTLCVRWGHALSNLFSVKNCVKQGGVL